MLLPPALGFSPHPPVSRFITVRVQYKQYCISFLVQYKQWLTGFVTIFPPSSSSHCMAVFYHTGTSACTGLSIPAPLSYIVPTVLLLCSTDINLLSIGYGSRPHLRSRLTQGRSALPWKPWIFGLEDSHLYLATHSGILSSI